MEENLTPEQAYYAMPLLTINTKLKDNNTVLQIIEKAKSKGFRVTFGETIKSQDMTIRRQNDSSYIAMSITAALRYFNSL